MILSSKDFFSLNWGEIEQLEQHRRRYRYRNQPIYGKRPWGRFKTMGSRPIRGYWPDESLWQYDDLTTDQTIYIRARVQRELVEWVKRGETEDYALYVWLCEYGIACPHFSHRQVWFVPDGHARECLDCRTLFRRVEPPFTERDRWEQEQRNWGTFIPRRDLTCKADRYKPLSPMARLITGLDKIPAPYNYCGAPLVFDRAEGPSEAQFIGFVTELERPLLSAPQRIALYRCLRGHEWREPISPFQEITKKYRGAIK